MSNASDSRKLCARADRARLKGRVRRAIRLYQRALEAGPEDAVTRRKLAPLLARRRRLEESWRCYEAACDSLVERGFDAQAAGLLAEAVTLLPRNEAAWRRLALIQAELGRRADARNSLAKARRNFKGRSRRMGAIRLLRDAHALTPDDLEIAIDLARLLRRAGRRRAAAETLYPMLQRAPGAHKRVRLELLRCTPTFDALVAWLRAPSDTPGAGPGAGRAQARTRS